MKLTFKYFGKVLKETLLEEGVEYFVGRQSDCHFILQERSRISRKHLKVYFSAESGHWVLETLSEYGGLYLSGQEVGTVEISSSSVFSLKDHTLEFSLGEEVGAEDPPPQEPKEDAPSSDPLPELTSALAPSLPSDLQIEEEKKDEKVMESFSEDGTRIVQDREIVHFLYIYINGEISSHVRLDRGESWLIGRAEDCDISIDYSVLTRKHLEISKVGGKFYVKDLGSSNRTFLNNEELEPLKPTRLKSGDKLLISDLKIVFEIRRKNFEKIMKNLPALSEQPESAGDSLPDRVFSKVVLEDAPPDGADGGKGAKSKLLTPARLILLMLIGGAAFAFWSLKSQEEEKTNQAVLEQRRKEKEHLEKQEFAYNQAVESLEQERYPACIEQFQSLHRLSNGEFKDSFILIEKCRTALENQKQKEAYLAQQEEKKRTEEKIQALSGKCRKQFDQKNIKTVDDLNRCAEELLQLDPQNAEISSIRMEIEEKESLKLLEEQKKASYRKFIQGKKALYYRAKKIHDRNTTPLKAVAAYDVFIRSARKVSALKALVDKAQSARDEIQNNYDSNLSTLQESCTRELKARQMKKAYYSCKKVLDFKSNDSVALNGIQQAEAHLKKRLQPLYKDSSLHESFSRIDEAKKIWKEIMEIDVRGGYYYKKAETQMKKYK